ncbi:FprA family A-type flavoprotein [bacterium]|nr:FprA family A-type flavoprotein [bacterium]
MSYTLCANVEWVGVVDWNIRDFHGYETDRGSSYNSYLICDEATALIDTVKESFADTLLANISVLTDLAAVKFVICNHAEPDHAGSLPRVMAALPDAEVVCNVKCREALNRQFDTSRWRFKIVSSGEELSLGKSVLRFIDTPMVHWPESMFTFMPQERILFSMDAFGQHYATSRRFDDENPEEIILEEARAYYANIVLPYSSIVTRLLGSTSDLKPTLIAPSHGIIWRTHIDRIVQAYHDWSSHKPQPKVLIIYDTMWNSTELMARAIQAGAEISGVDARLIHLRRSSHSRIAAEVQDAAAVAFGSPTLNGTMMPMAGALLTYLKGLRPQGKVAFAFGSFGWGNGGPEEIDEIMRKLKWDLTRPPLKAQFRPTAEILEECRREGRQLATRALELTSGTKS